MNLRFVFKLVGRVELMVAASLLLPLAVALFYGESPWPFVLTMGLILCVCAPLARMPAQPVFFQREGFVIVGLIWVVTCLFGSLPFWFSGCFASFVDCLFEASSGFTTTGATILPDIEILPRGIQFWRCFTHWLGGHGGAGAGHGGVSLPGGPLPVPDPGGDAGAHGGQAGAQAGQDL